MQKTEIRARYVWRILLAMGLLAGLLVFAQPVQAQSEPSPERPPPSELDPPPFIFPDSPIVFTEDPTDRSRDPANSAGALPDCTAGVVRILPGTILGERVVVRFDTGETVVAGEDLTVPIPEGATRYTVSFPASVFTTDRDENGNIVFLGYPSYQSGPLGCTPEAEPAPTLTPPSGGSTGNASATNIAVQSSSQTGISIGGVRQQGGQNFFNVSGSEVQQSTSQQQTSSQTARAPVAPPVGAQKPIILFVPPQCIQFPTDPNGSPPRPGCNIGIRPPGDTLSCTGGPPFILARSPTTPGGGSPTAPGNCRLVAHEEPGGSLVCDILTTVFVPARVMGSEQSPAFTLQAFLCRQT